MVSRMLTSFTLGMSLFVLLYTNGRLAALPQEEEEDRDVGCLIYDAVDDEKFPWIEAGCEPIPEWVAKSRNEQSGGVPDWIYYLGFVKSQDGQKVEHGWWCEFEWWKHHDPEYELNPNVAYWMTERSGWDVDTACKRHFGPTAKPDCRLLCCEGETNRTCWSLTDCGFCTPPDQYRNVEKDCCGECLGTHAMYESYNHKYKQTACLDMDRVDSSKWKRTPRFTNAIPIYWVDTGPPRRKSLKIE